MRFEDLQDNWEGYGTENPLWAVHTGRGNIEWDEAEFFDTGVAEIDALLAELARLGADPPRARALDFGCGVGRLSLALAGHFDRVDGVDISRPMLEGAEKFRSGSDDIDISAVRFHLNTELDLALFESGTFSFVLSLVTLQHMKPEFSAIYIAEFCRVTGPGGVLAFQIPARRTTPLLRIRGGVGRTVRRLRPARTPVMEMYGTPRAAVETNLRDHGMRIVAVEADDRADTWESYTYVAVKD